MRKYVEAAGHGAMWDMWISSSRSSPSTARSTTGWVATVSAPAEDPLRFSLCLVHNGVMSLRYALLALLSARPLSAYDIAKQFGSSVGFVWYARDSQIYPQLWRMEEDGLVAATELPSGGRRTKREYRITDEGVRQFRSWINEPGTSNSTESKSSSDRSYGQRCSTGATPRCLIGSRVRHRLNTTELWRSRSLLMTG